MEFSEKIKMICKKENLNIKEFSELVGISYSSMTSYTSGRRTPNWEQLNKIANTPRLSKYQNFIFTLESPDFEIRESTPDEYLNTDEVELLKYFRESSSDKKEELIKLMHELRANQKE